MTELVTTEKRRSRKPANMEVGHSDHFQTPPSALGPLLPLLRKMEEQLQRPPVVWEPACGKGNLVRGLRIAGFGSFGTDIDPLKWDRREEFSFDFLTDRQAFEYDAIITNPPYTIKDRFIARCYELGKPWALLLPVGALAGGKRQAMFRRYGLQIILMPSRVDFETPSGGGSSSWFDTAWFCWGFGLPDSLNFAAPGQTHLSFDAGDDD